MMKIQKMIKDPGENELPNRQEGGTSETDKHQRRTRQWSSLSNPRIVRVSRAFGGKDRHSKVSTIKGLRDRRVRLSVPTATQLYDLQDKLHLNQPSKVVDWLIDAAQEEIDKLPPLPLIPASFIQFPQPWASSSAADVVLNDEHINTTNNRVQSFSFNADPVLGSSNFAHEDVAASFLKFRGITKDHVDDMPYTSSHQWEPSNAYTSGTAAENTSDQEFHLASALSTSRSLMPGPQYFMMPTMPSSSYVTSPNHFQWNSSGSNATMYSNINFRQYVNHQEQHHEAQQENSLTERHAGDGSNTASFF